MDKSKMTNEEIFAIESEEVKNNLRPKVEKKEEVKKEEPKVEDKPKKSAKKKEE